jgi:tetratricopeptide (TPR) repeat protein
MTVDMNPVNDTIKRISFFAAACFLLFAGCRQSDEKEIKTIPPLAEHGPTSESNQNPYYYGLIEEYRTILAEDPDNVAAIIALGNAYLESAAWREAIKQYERALRYAPRNADVHTDMGTAYRNLAMPDRALAHYRLALQHEPGHLNARYNIGVLYAFDYRDYGVAVRVWEELLRLAPNYPNANYMRNCMVTFRKTAEKGHP